MTRWLQAALAAQPPHDTNDKNAPERIKSFLSFMSEGADPDFCPSPVCLPEHAGRPVSTADYDLWVEFKERAAILEYEGGYFREEAERLSRLEVYGS